MPWLEYVRVEWQNKGGRDPKIPLTRSESSFGFSIGIKSGLLKTSPHLPLRFLAQCFENSPSCGRAFAFFGSVLLHSGWDNFPLSCNAT